MKKKFSSQFGFYGILTNPLRGYEFCTELMVRKGVVFIQLRMKDAEAADVLPVAKKMRALTQGTSSIFVVNDYPEIAAEVGADGVHVGQRDMPIEKVREIVGPDMLIGLSTHSPEQTRLACEKQPDYIGIGPVYPTPTKKIADPAIGISGMKEMLGIATVPAVILGALTRDNLGEAIREGAKNFSVVRPICATDDPESALDEIVAVYKDACDSGT